MTRSRLVVLAMALWLSAGALLADDDTPSIVPEVPATPQALADIAQYSEMAQRATVNGDLVLAEKSYENVLDVDAPDTAKKQALFNMFECYRTHNIYSKAIAVGEAVKVGENFGLRIRQVGDMKQLIASLSGENR